jgi:hypothetical protein
MLGVGSAVRRAAFCSDGYVARAPPHARSIVILLHLPLVLRGLFCSFFSPWLLAAPRLLLH